MTAPVAAPVEEARLILFVAGDGRRSRASTLRAQQLANWFDHLTLRVIDVVQEPDAAESELVLVTPSLVVDRPGRRHQVIAGDLPPAQELAELLGLATPTEADDSADRAQVIARLWDSNPDGALVVDADGIVCFVNDACEALFGRPAAALVGTPLSLPAALDEPAELEIPRAGHLRTVELRTATVMWEGRRAVMATLRDVTEQKALFDELRQTRAELARSNEDLERFAAIAAHDLKAPLFVISGAAELLGDVYGGGSDPNARTLIDAITRSASRMTELLDAVLDAAHAGADLDLQPTDLGAVVEEVEALLRPQIEAAAASIDVGPLPTALVDPTQMATLFQNLISNAIKYRSGERPLQIHISAADTDDGIVVTVADNGIGIDEADRDRVFTLLDRLPTGMSQAGGHGIGLTICRRVVERHGGRIWIDDAAEGTAFRFSIPRRAL